MATPEEKAIAIADAGKTIGLDFRPAGGLVQAKITKEQEANLATLYSKTGIDQATLFGSGKFHIVDVQAPPGLGARAGGAVIGGIKGGLHIGGGNKNARGAVNVDAEDVAVGTMTPGKEHVIRFAPGALSDQEVQAFTDPSHLKAIKAGLDGDFATVQSIVRGGAPASPAASAPSAPAPGGQDDVAAKLSSNEVKFNGNLEAHLTADQANHLKDAVKAGVDPKQLFGSDKFKISYETNDQGDITGASIKANGQLTPGDVDNYNKHKTAIDLTVQKGADPAILPTIKSLIAFAEGHGKPAELASNEPQHGLSIAAKQQAAAAIG